MRNDYEPTSDTYVKKFDKLSDGFKELQKITNDPNIEGISFDGCESFLDEYKAIAKHCSNIILDDNNFPNFMGEDFPDVYGVSVFGNRFYFRTNDIYSFSFNIHTRDIDTVDSELLSMYISIKKPHNPVAVVNYNKIVKELNDLGWLAYEGRRRRNSFGYRRGSDSYLVNHMVDNRLQATTKKTANTTQEVATASSGEDVYVATSIPIDSGKITNAMSKLNDLNPAEKEALSKALGSDNS